MSCFLWSICCLPHATAQVEQDYEPQMMSDASLDLMLQQMEGRYAHDISTLPKPYRKEVTKAYLERKNNVVANVKNGHFITTPFIQEYFDQILKEILTANPDLPQNEIRLLISRYPWPNASCLGEGTIMINIGLIRRLESESQIAFVVAHEIAHYVLNHVNEAIVQRMEVLHSKATKQELARITKSGYRTTEKAMELLRGMIYEDSRHSRLHESEADELALTYLLNTQYDATEALKCLTILDSIDEEKYDAPLAIGEVFDSPDYPFKDKWLTAEDSFFQVSEDDEEEWHKDSLKTHPDCRKRIRILRRSLTEYDADSFKDFVQSEAVFF